MNVEQTALATFRQALEQLADKAPFDDLTDDQRLARANSAFLAGLDRRKAVDLDTCIHCGMCAESCHFYIATGNERYTPAYKVEPLRRFYRREMSPMRMLYRPFTRKVGIDDLRAWQELVFDACTGCGRCDMMCPMGINISEGINLMRQGLAAAGLVPAELAALQYEQREHDTLFGIGGDDLRTLVTKLAANGVDIPLDKASAEVLLLTTAVEVRLFPDAVTAYAKILQRAGADWTMSTDAFEATNLGLISGDRRAMRTAVSRIRARVKALGARTIVVPESGHAYQALRWEAADELGEELPCAVMAIAEFVASRVHSGALTLKAATDIRSVAYHDPCRLARQGGVFDEPRALLEAVGLEVRETASNRRENLCCGGGCGEYAIGRGATIRQRAFELKRHELDATYADAVVTGCNNCRLNLLVGAHQSGWDKPVVSLAETIAGNLAE